MRNAELGGLYFFKKYFKKEEENRNVLYFYFMIYLQIIFNIFMKNINTDFEIEYYTQNLIATTSFCFLNNINIAEHLLGHVQL